MIKKIIKLFLIYCRLYKKPVYINKKIVFCERVFGGISRLSFDGDFYLECYDDIRLNGIDPVLHYYHYGRSEGRVGTPFAPQIEITKIDKSRDALLLVTHELSATGAPILAYNIAKELCKKYNVFVISLGGGPLHGEFSNLGVHLFCESGLRHSEQMSKYFIEKLHDEIFIKFAIVNSIESTSVLSGLYKLNIPTVSLVHEFPSYSGGLDRFRRCIYWSTYMLLSSDMAKTDLLKTGQVSDSRKISVLPQGKCVVPTYDGKNSSPLPVEKSDGVIRVVGAGTITYRKGVDIFIECARAIREEIPSGCLEFIWIGKNVDSALGTDYFQYLEDQVNRSGLQSCFRFIGEADSYEEILNSADIFLMTSRLDPLPNVAIDALALNLPVFFFRNASGLSSLISKTSLESCLCADYLSPSNMASKVVRYIRDERKNEKLTEVKRFYEENFKFDTYINRLETYLKEAVASHEQMNGDADFIRLNSGINEHFCNPEIWGLFGPEDLVKRYVNMWKSNIYRYRPVPDFHPSIYRDIINPQCDPYAHYVRSGRPDGPWKSELVNLEESTSVVRSELAVALHVHCYYPELLKDILFRLGGNNSKVDVYVSTNTQAKKEAISSVFAEFNAAPISIDVTPNVGRDIGPFLSLYCGNLSDRYDVIFHVHTKKSPHVNEESGRNWYEYCLENLLGGVGGNVLDKILAEFRDKSLGLAYPSDPNALGWGDNYEYAGSVLSRLGLEAKQGEFNFPIGTMFAASKLLVRRLADLNFDWDEYPCEPLPIDGTMLHAIERSIPCISEDLGLRQMLVYANKTTRV